MENEAGKRKEAESGAGKEGEWQRNEENWREKRDLEGSFGNSGIGMRNIRVKNDKTRINRDFKAILFTKRRKNE